MSYELKGSDCSHPSDCSAPPYTNTGQKNCCILFQMLIHAYVHY